MTAESKELKPRLARLEMVYVRSPVYFVTACTKTAGRYWQMNPSTNRLLILRHAAKNSEPGWEDTF